MTPLSGASILLQSYTIPEATELCYTHLIIQNASFTDGCIKFILMFSIVYNLFVHQLCCCFILQHEIWHSFTSDCFRIWALGSIRGDAYFGNVDTSLQQKYWPLWNSEGKAPVIYFGKKCMKAWQVCKAVNQVNTLICLQSTNFTNKVEMNKASLWDYFAKCFITFYLFIDLKKYILEVLYYLSCHNTCNYCNTGIASGAAGSVGVVQLQGLGFDHDL